jgi:hypothetical protein
MFSKLEFVTDSEMPLKLIDNPSPKEVAICIARKAKRPDVVQKTFQDGNSVLIGARRVVKNEYSMFGACHDQFLEISIQITAVPLHLQCERHRSEETAGFVCPSHIEKPFATDCKWT